MADTMRLINPGYVTLLESLTERAYAFALPERSTTRETRRAAFDGLVVAVSEIDEHRMRCVDDGHPRAYEEIASGHVHFLCPDCGYTESKPMMTTCENCSCDVRHDEVQRCEACGMDGLCPCCIGDADHRCSLVLLQ